MNFDNAHTCNRAVNAIDADTASNIELAVGVVMATWVLAGQPSFMEEAVMGLARTVILDAEIAALKAKLSA